WIADRARVYVGPDDSPVRMIGARMDITVNRRTESALRLSEERLRLALEAGRLGSWEFSLQTGALVTSAQCKANHGLAADAALTFEDVVEAIPASHRERLPDALAAAVASRGTFTVELP